MPCSCITFISPIFKVHGTTVILHFLFVSIVEDDSITQVSCFIYSWNSSFPALKNFLVLQQQKQNVTVHVRPVSNWWTRREPTSLSWWAANLMRWCERDLLYAITELLQENRLQKSGRRWKIDTHEPLFWHFEKDSVKVDTPEGYLSVTEWRILFDNFSMRYLRNVMMI